MTNSPVLNMVLGGVTALCVAVTEITAIDLTENLTIAARIASVLSFVIILVSNWSKFKGQVKSWLK